MTARTVTITGIGDFRQLQAELERTGVISAQSTKSIQDGAAAAGDAAAKQAEAMGASADEQEAAAGRAAAAYVDGAAKMTQAQKAAAAAAAAAADASGASADEIVAASARAVEAQRALEDSAGGIGTAFTDGTDKAGSALTKLGAMGASWGIPLSGSLTKMGKEFDEAESKSEKFGSALASTGKLALTAGLAGFAVAAVEGVKGASSLQASMTRLETQAGASSKQVKTLTGDVLDMAGEVGAKPNELAEGMYHVVSALNATTPAAQRVSTEYGVMKAAAEGAQVGNANIVDVTNALDAAVISGLPGLGSYTHAMGALNTIVGAGDMTMENLAEALGTGLLGPMKNFGVSLQDIGGALAVFGDNNLRGAAAATKLSSAIRIMAAPSKTAAGYLAEVGISATELGNDIRSKGLVDALEDLKKHLEDSGDTATQQMRVLSNAFGGRQAMGVQILLAQLERLKDKVKDVSQGGSNFGADWQKRTENLTAQIDKLRGSVDADADRLGFYLIPKLEAAGQATGKVIQWFEKNNAAAEALGLVVGGLLSAAVGAFAAQKAVAFYGGVTKMWEGMQKLASGATSAVATIISKFAAEDEAVTTTAQTTMTETEAIAGAYGSMSDAAAAAAADIEAANEAVVESTETTAAATDAALGASGIGAALGVLGLAAIELEQHWKTVMTAMEEAAQTAANGIIKALNAAISVIEKLSFGLLKISNVGELEGAGGTKFEKQASAAESKVLSEDNAAAKRHREQLTREGKEPAAGSAAAQKVFGAELAALTHLSPKVIGAWLAQEQPEGSPASPGSNDWLNIETGFGPGSGVGSASEKYVGSRSARSAAQLTAEWLRKYQAGILHAAGKGEAAEIEAIKNSGFAESHYPNWTPGTTGYSLTSGPGTPEPPTAAQEKAKTKAEDAAERAARELKDHIEKITGSAESLLKKYEAEVQNSTPTAIEKALGVSTTGKYKGVPGLVERAARSGNAGPLEAELGKSAAGSEAGRQEAKLVSELRGTHQKALEELAARIVATHKQALSTLAGELVSVEETKLGEQLKVQATEEKDRTTQLEHSATDQLNIVKAEQAQQTDAMKAAAQAVADATQSMSDSFQALTQSIEDQSKIMADSSNAVVQGIKDQTNIEVAVLGERGLYGLNLIAQKLEVQLDEERKSYDQQIAAAKTAEDTLTASWQQVTAQDQQILDEDKAAADAQTAAAQAHLDAVTVAQDQRIAAAQAEVDSAQLHADQLIGNAELKVLAAAGGGKRKEAEAAAGLKIAEGEGAQLVASKEGALAGVNAAANTAINAAADELTRTTESWAKAIKEAEQALAKAKGESAEQLAKAQQNVQSIEDKAAEAEAKKEKEVQVERERGQVQYQGSGLVINQYGIEYGDANANASALGWELRQQLPV